MLWFLVLLGFTQLVGLDSEKAELREAMDVPMLDIGMVIREEEPFETGIASTYGVGDGFQGNRTACGQIFDTHVVQVAHKTLKCGTLIRIEDAETGKSVVAEVTDRGPYIRGRIVDLSWAAFRELDPAGGLRPVRVYLVD
jgi:rare lipoprotein A